MYLFDCYGNIFVYVDFHLDEPLRWAARDISLVVMYPKCSITLSREVSTSRTAALCLLPPTVLEWSDMAGQNIKMIGMHNLHWSDEHMVPGSSDFVRAIPTTIRQQRQIERESTGGKHCFLVVCECFRRHNQCQSIKSHRMVDLIPYRSGIAVLPLRF
jgi:hypothetical protein